MQINNLSVKVAVPTYNAGTAFKNFIQGLLDQQGLQPMDVLVVDSSSSDETASLAKNAGFNVKSIFHKEFSHGGTRVDMVRELDADIIVFLTQDAILADNSAIINLINVFKNDKIAAAYGKQLPNKNTSAFGTFARQFNYGSKSFVNKLDDREKKGIKVAFLSDSFSAYRKKDLLAIGNFDRNLQFGEDTIAAAKLLLAGYETAYCADACVYHAHSYSIWEEFQRYYDTGKFHKEQHWLLDEFGKAEGEGLKFVKKEAEYLIDEGKWYLLPVAFIRNVAKYAGYWLGMHS